MDYAAVLVLVSYMVRLSFTSEEVFWWCLTVIIDEHQLLLIQPDVQRSCWVTMSVKIVLINEPNESLSSYCICVSVPPGPLVICLSSVFQREAAQVCPYRRMVQ